MTHNLITITSDPLTAQINPHGAELISLCDESRNFRMNVRLKEN